MKRLPKLSDQIRAAVKASALTRYRISKLTGIDQGILSRFTAGKAGMTLENVDRLAAALHLRIVADPKSEK
jgi:hypothetical protein